MDNVRHEGNLLENLECVELCNMTQSVLEVELVLAQLLKLDSGKKFWELLPLLCNNIHLSSTQKTTLSNFKL